MTRKQIYEKALILWGRTAQIDMLVEECAELIIAAQKFNHRYGRYNNVVEKLADVEIMCEQMRIIFDPVKIDEIKELKVKQLTRPMRTQGDDYIQASD